MAHKKQKLIRDKVGPGTPEYEGYIMSGKESYSLDMLTDRVMLSLLLVGKAHEEIEEVREDMKDPLEYGDVVQVLMDLAELNGVSWSEIEHQRKLKTEHRGRFLHGRALRRESW